MSLHYIYSDSTGSTVDITAYCRLYRFSATTDAKEGSVGHSTLIVDDPDGFYSFVGHRRIYAYEDLAASSNQVVYNGFIYGEKISRGPYRIGAGRIWTLDLVDPNVLLNRRLMNGADTNRPAETDVARMEALIGIDDGIPMTELNTIDDTLYFSGVDPVDMDAVNYQTQPTGTGYIEDCRQASGKNAFVWYREALGEYSLWYDFASSSNWTGTKRLSNVLADVDGSTTFAIDLENEAEDDIDPSRVASGVMLPFDGVAVGSNTINGTVYVQNAVTTAAFAAIDWLAPSVNVKTKAMALARANRYLADATEEDHLIHCSVKLPAANVNDFMAGMRFDAKFSHFPDYGQDGEFHPFRCLSRTVNEISEDPTRAYRLDLELSPITPIPLEQYDSQANYQQESLFLWPDGPPGEGNLLIGVLASRSLTPSVDTDTVPGSFAGPSNLELLIAGTEWTNIDGFDVSVGVGGGLAMAWRDSTADDTEYLRWGNPPPETYGRPREHHMEISGLSGAPSVVVSQANSSVVGTTYYSDPITVPAAGYIIGGFHFDTSGPSDRFGWGGFSMAGISPTIMLTSGWMFDNFGGFSALCYRYVSAAGTYTPALSLERTGAAFDGDDKYGWIIGFWAGPENPAYPG